MTCETPNLQKQPVITLDAGAEHFFVAGDFDGNSKQDLVVYTAAAISKLYTLSGDGTGKLMTTNTKVLTTVSVPVYQISSGEFNGDGKPDLVIANNDSGTVSLLLNGCGK